MKDNEAPAKGSKGFLLYNPFTGKHFFRIYGEMNEETGHKDFKDYALCAEDIEIEINDSFVSLYEHQDNEGRLDYSSKTLGR